MFLLTPLSAKRIMSQPPETPPSSEPGENDRPGVSENPQSSEPPEANGISAERLKSGLRSLIVESVCTRVMVSLTGSAFMVGMAIALDASNLVVGILAAIFPLSQVVQVPALLWVNKLSSRKRLVLVATVLSRTSLVAVALIPFFVARPLQIPFYILCLVSSATFYAVSSCTKKSWLGDLIPADKRGSFFGTIGSISTIAGAIMMLVVGMGVDVLINTTGNESLSFAAVFLIGGTIGLLGVFFLGSVPEPRMEPRKKVSFLKTISEPLHDKRFRCLIYFSAISSFATVMGAAFSIIYMLKRVDISIGMVVSLAVMSQLIQAWFLKIWGPIADRTSNKSVLLVCCPLFLLSYLLFPFTTMPEYWAGSIPLLILIHVLLGISGAGVFLGTANIVVEFAPRGRATSYFAANGAIGGLAAMCSPVLGGWMADFFDERKFSLVAVYMPIEGPQVQIPAMILSGLDFVFLFAVLAGVLALHELTRIEEKGEIEETDVVRQAINSARGGIIGLSGRLLYFPLGVLDTVAVKPARKAVGLAKKDKEDGPE